MSEAHGGKNLRELKSLGVDSEDVLDLSANVSLYGTPASVLKAIKDTDVSVYPDPHCTELRGALARREGVRSENVLAGNGSTELIRLAAQAFAEEGALIAGPTFSEYAEACKGLDIPFHEIRSMERTNFTFDFKSGSKSPLANPSAIFLCNPNNPTGVYLSQRDVEKLASLFPNATLIIDEAFIHFAAPVWDSVRLSLSRNVILIRSLTKLYAMPGIRLGYAIGGKKLIDRLASLQPTWSVSSPAQLAGIAALKEETYASKVIKETLKNRASVRKSLLELGFDVLESQTNFLLVKVSSASDVKRGLLLRNKILVRDCTSFGLPEHIRIAIGDSDSCDRLVSGMQSIVKSKVAEGKKYA